MFSAGKEKKIESFGLSSEVMHAIIRFSLTITFNLTLGMKWSIIKWNQSCKMASCCFYHKVFSFTFYFVCITYFYAPHQCVKESTKRP